MQGIDALQKRLAAISEPRKRNGTIGLLAVREGKSLVHRLTGNLGRTIRLGTVTDDSVEVLAGGRLNVGYAAAEEKGRKAITIRAKPGKVLAWGGGRTLGGRLRAGQRPTHFAKLVRQKARKPHPFLVPGIKAALRKAGLKAQVVDAWNRAA